jgi:hypothetical protein
MLDYLSKQVKVIVDRPLCSRHLQALVEFQEQFFHMERISC